MAANKKDMTKEICTLRKEVKELRERVQQLELKSSESQVFGPIKTDSTTTDLMFKKWMEKK